LMIQTGAAADSGTPGMASLRFSPRQIKGLRSWN
jgi:hypothetical protein